MPFQHREQTLSRQAYRRDHLQADEIEQNPRLVYKWLLYSLILYTHVRIHIPRKKQQLSDTLVSNMLGPTWPSVRPMCSGIDSFGRLPSLWWVCTRIKILSTPTASTRNGMTSMMINVAGTPINPNNPTEQITDASTMSTPPSPRVILESYWNTFEMDFTRWNFKFQ